MIDLSMSPKKRLLGFIERSEIKYHSHIKGVSRPTAKKLFWARHQKRFNLKMGTILTALLTHGYEVKIHFGERGVEADLWRKKDVDEPPKKVVKNLVKEFRNSLEKHLRDIVKDSTKNSGEPTSKFLGDLGVEKYLLSRTNPAKIDELLDAIAKTGDCGSFYIRQPYSGRTVYLEYGNDGI